MIARDVTDFPQPDSPTRPIVSPGATAKLTPSTARVDCSPLRVNVTARSSTSSTGVRAQTAVTRTHLRNFGSRASRSDSPSSVKPSATMMMQSAG